MQERHENEQYFFTPETVAQAADVLGAYEHPCVLCAPLVGAELSERGKRVTVLDIDERFSDVRGFQHWDLYRPQRLESRFDIILCDPPFFNVSLSQLFKALQVLSHYDYQQKLVVGYLKRRSDSVIGTFARFGLQPTGWCPAYQTVQKVARNEIEFFSNVPDLPGTA